VPAASCTHSFIIYLIRLKIPFTISKFHSLFPLQQYHYRPNREVYYLQNTMRLEIVLISYLVIRILSVLEGVMGIEKLLHGHRASKAEVSP